MGKGRPQAYVFDILSISLERRSKQCAEVFLGFPQALFLEGKARRSVTDLM